MWNNQTWADDKSHLVRDIDEIAVNDFKEVETNLCGIRLACRSAPTADVADSETARVLTFVAGCRQEE